MPDTRHPTSALRRPTRGLARPSGVRRLRCHPLATSDFVAQMGFMVNPAIEKVMHMSNQFVSPRRLTAEEAALCTAYLIYLYTQEKGKDVTRLRLSRNSVRWLGLRGILREAFVDDWIEELATEWGWIAFPHGEEFGLIDASVMSGWVRIGTRRIDEARLKLKHGDRSLLDKMREALAQRKLRDDDLAED